MTPQEIIAFWEEGAKHAERERKNRCAYWRETIPEIRSLSDEAIDILWVYWRENFSLEPMKLNTANTKGFRKWLISRNQRQS